jgi:hypothetical protein
MIRNFNLFVLGVVELNIVAKLKNVPYMVIAKAMDM